MEFSEKLKSLLLNENTSNEEILNYYNVLTNAWHDSNQEDSLPEFLGLSDDMYTLFTEDFRKFVKVLKITMQDHLILELLNKNNIHIDHLD